MNRFWHKGRQNPTYFKMNLLSMLNFDMFLLKFPKGSYIASHLDPVQDGFEHHRINIILKKPKKGGYFFTKLKYYFSERVIKFRPDIQEHGVTIVEDGTRYVLSIGWLKKS